MLRFLEASVLVNSDASQLEHFEKNQKQICNQREKLNLKCTFTIKKNQRKNLLFCQPVLSSFHSQFYHLLNPQRVYKKSFSVIITVYTLL
jgi:hypothetical protein